MFTSSKAIAQAQKKLKIDSKTDKIKKQNRTYMQSYVI